MILIIKETVKCNFLYQFNIHNTILLIINKNKNLFRILEKTLKNLNVNIMMMYKKLPFSFITIK